MNVLRKLTSAVRKHGVLGILRSIPNFAYWRFRYEADHARWDRRWGTETAQSEQDYLKEISDGVVRDAEWYEPIRWRWFRPILRDTAIDPHEYSFVDLGSGKGRALFFAASQGFHRVIGVEFSAMLHAVALQNVVSFSAREPAATLVELVHGDATSVEFPAGPTVIFLNNPFRGEVMARVVERIAEHAAGTQSPTLVVYKQPAYRSLFEEHPAFELVVDRPGNGRSFLGREPYIIMRVRSRARGESGAGRSRSL